MCVETPSPHRNAVAVHRRGRGVDAVRCRWPRCPPSQNPPSSDCGPRPISAVSSGRIVVVDQVLMCAACSGVAGVLLEPPDAVLTAGDVEEVPRLEEQDCFRRCRCTRARRWPQAAGHRRTRRATSGCRRRTAGSGTAAACLRPRAQVGPRAGRRHRARPPPERPGRGRRTWPGGGGRRSRRTPCRSGPAPRSARRSRRPRRSAHGWRRARRPGTAAETRQLLPSLFSLTLRAASAHATT